MVKRSSMRFCGIMTISSVACEGDIDKELEVENAFHICVCNFNQIPRGWQLLATSVNRLWLRACLYDRGRWALIGYDSFFRTGVPFLHLNPLPESLLWQIFSWKMSCLPKLRLSWKILSFLRFSIILLFCFIQSYGDRWFCLLTFCTITLVCVTK